MISIKLSYHTVLHKSIKTSKILIKHKKTLMVMQSDNSINSNTQGSEFLTPGKIKVTEIEIKEREKKLKALAEKWKLDRLKKEEYERKTFGFSKNSEILNGRLAMFFLVTGLLTEYWTKQNILQQIETIIRTLGLL